MEDANKISVGQFVIFFYNFVDGFVEEKVQWLIITDWFLKGIHDV